MRKGLATPKLLTLPKDLQVALGTLYEGFENKNDWTAASGAVANDAVNFKSGTQSVKLTTNAGATATMTKTVNWDLSSAWGRAQLWFYQYNAQADYGGSTMLMLATDAGVTKYFRYWWSQAQLVTPAPCWNVMNIPKAYFGVIGGAVWTDLIIRVRLQVVGAATKTPAMSFDSLSFGIQSLPGIILCFDDAYSSAYTIAYPKMKQWGIKGVVAVETDLVGTGNHLTWAQIRELAADGWLMANHTNASTQLAGQAEAAQEAQIAAGHDDLIANGVPGGAHYLVYPSGTSDANSYIAAAAQGILTARGVNPWYRGQNVRMPLFPHSDLFQLDSLGVTNTVSVATAEGYVDNAPADGMVDTFHFHDVGGAAQWTQAQFNQFIDEKVGPLKAAGLLQSLTYADWFNLSQGAIRIKRR